MGIHDKKLLSIISAMLKAEVAGIGFPEKGTPQGGIISPLLPSVPGVLLPAFFFRFLYANLIFSSVVIILMRFLNSRFARLFSWAVGTLGCQHNYEHLRPRHQGGKAFQRKASGQGCEQRLTRFSLKSSHKGKIKGKGQAGKTPNPWKNRVFGLTDCGWYQSNFLCTTWISSASLIFARSAIVLPSVPGVLLPAFFFRFANLRSKILWDEQWFPSKSRRWKCSGSGWKAYAEKQSAHRHRYWC